MPGLRDAKLGLEFAKRAAAKCTDAYHHNRFILALAYHANGDLDKAIEMVKRALAGRKVGTGVGRKRG